VARAAARRYGAHLVDAARLSAPDDVFFLTRDEVISNLPDNAADVVAARKQRWNY
jgi:hypothetical protein